jgi:hypothetical protein
MDSKLSSSVDAKVMVGARLCEKTVAEMVECKTFEYARPNDVWVMWSADRREFGVQRMVLNKAKRMICSCEKGNGVFMADWMARAMRDYAGEIDDSLFNANSRMYIRELVMRYNRHCAEKVVRRPATHQPDGRPSSSAMETKLRKMLKRSRQKHKSKSGVLDAISMVRR